MPRPWRLRVEHYPEYVEGRWYLVEPYEIEPSADGVRVSLRHRDRAQEGRRHDVILPIPLRPCGLANEFFQAAGIAVVAGGTVDPKAALGVPMRVRLAQAENVTDWVAAAFAPLPSSDASVSPSDPARDGAVADAATPACAGDAGVRRPTI